MHRTEIELRAGDVVCIGEHRLTVVEIDGEDVCFRIALLDDSQESQDADRALPPR